MRKTCPDCGLLLNNGRCGCGYSEKTNLAVDPENHRCAYTQNGRRCSFPGNVTSSTKPDSHTQWYCSDHYWNLDNPVAGAQVFDQMDRGEIVINRIDWRDELINQKLRDRAK